MLPCASVYIFCVSQCRGDESILGCHETLRSHTNLALISLCVSAKLTSPWKSPNAAHMLKPLHIFNGETWPGVCIRTTLTKVTHLACHHQAVKIKLWNLWHVGRIRHMALVPAEAVKHLPKSSANPIKHRTRHMNPNFGKVNILVRCVKKTSHFQWFCPSAPPSFLIVECLLNLGKMALRLLLLSPSAICWWTVLRGAITAIFFISNDSDKNLPLHRSGALTLHDWLLIKLQIKLIPVGQPDDLKLWEEGERCFDGKAKVFAAVNM